MTLTDHYGNPRRPHRFSQCGKILRFLEDGQWHSTAEILREVPCIVHSRVSDLRLKFGWPIEHEVGPGRTNSERSRYRLLRSSPTPSGSGRPSHAPAPAVSASPGTTALDREAVGSGVTSGPVAPEQLQMEAA